MVSVSEIRKAQRAEGPATILAIGTANPANCVEKYTYPDFYFKITNSEHKIELKEKFQRICKYFSPLFHFSDTSYLCNTQQKPLCAYIVVTLQYDGAKIKFGVKF